MSREVLWLEQRRALNHDRLRNGLINMLQGWLSVLEGGAKGTVVVDSAFERLSRWPQLSSEVRAIARSFTDDMSPCRLLSGHPLSALNDESRTWLATLIHDAWLRRCAVPQWVSRIEAATIRVDKASRILVAMAPDEVQPESLREMIEACRDLARELEWFPRDRRFG